jgi:hypothetical protein
VRTIRIRVDEAFKGVKTRQKITLLDGGTDCAIGFRTGERAVFYLYGGAAHACTRIRGYPDPLGDDMLFLRGLPKSAEGTRLSGEVDLYKDPATRTHGLPNVLVSISGPRGLKRQAKTNADGAFEIFGLPPGRYSASIAVPQGYKLDDSWHNGPSFNQGPDAMLTEGGGAFFHFTLRADTQISGRALNSDGKAVENVCASLEPDGGEAERFGWMADCSKKSGRFEISMMPPGKYRVKVWENVATGASSSESTFYYPGVRDRSKAAVIAIEPNRPFNFDVRLPAADRRRLEGRLFFTDGVPAADARITFLSKEHRYSEVTMTGKDGSFLLPVVAGFTGELSAELFVDIEDACPQLKTRPGPPEGERIVDSNPVQISGNAIPKGMILRLNSPSCESWFARTSRQLFGP